MGRLAAALALALLAGCGFHLRGHGPAALGVAKVAIDPASPEAARRALARAGLESDPDAPVRIRILAWRTQREVVSVDASGRPEGYRLHLLIDYRLERDGRPEGGTRRLDLFRDYRSPPEQALAREDQEAPLLADLWREAAARLAAEAAP